MYNSITRQLDLFHRIIEIVDEVDDTSINRIAFTSSTISMMEEEEEKKEEVEEEEEIEKENVLEDLEDSFFSSGIYGGDII